MEKVGAVNGVQELHYECDYRDVRLKNRGNQTMADCFFTDDALVLCTHEIRVSPQQGSSK